MDTMPNPTIRRISAKGDAYTIGRTIGEAVADTVQSISVHNAEFAAAGARWAGSHYLDQLEAAARNEYPEYTRELEGMADGMGIPFAKAFLWNCRGDLRWPDDIAPEVAAGLSEGCTTLIIPADGDKPAIIAHNEDGAQDFHEHCFWVSAEPDDGPGFDSFLYPGMMPGHTMAVNNAGIVQTINNMRVHDLKPGLPRHFVCRAILDCEHMDDALALLQRTDRASGFHHNLGSAREGRLASVEAPASGCQVIEVTETPSAHANHLVMDGMKDIPQSITKSSGVRQVRAAEHLERDTHKAGGPEGVLFDAHPGHEIHRTPNDGGDDYGRTLATGVFELTESGVGVSIHNGPNNKNVLTFQLTI